MLNKLVIRWMSALQSGGPLGVVLAPGFGLIGAVVGAAAESKSWCPDAATAEEPPSE